jgi:RNA polymerase sigma-70 factor (ECF subfamily)
VPVQDADPPDVAVIAQVLAGETALFELLMRRHNERVYRAARSIVRDEQEAEDVMQQAYVNAFTHLRQFNGSAQFSTWLTRIVINEALARVRRQGRYEVFDDTRPMVEPLMTRNPSDNPERQALTGELHGLLEGAIDSLPNGMREVFVLREVEGLSTAETAACLALRPETVKTRLHRARLQLQETLGQDLLAASLSLFEFEGARCDRIVGQVLAHLGQPMAPDPSRSAGASEPAPSPRWFSRLLALFTRRRKR